MFENKTNPHLTVFVALYTASAIEINDVLFLLAVEFIVSFLGIVCLHWGIDR